MKLTRSILLAALAVAPSWLPTTTFGQTAPAVGSAAPIGDLEPSRILADQVASASRQLGDPSLDQVARDAAAARLLAIGTAEARNAVLYALKDPGNNPGRLAAARAIADDRPPDPQFVDALFVLLDADTPRPLLDAAAVALGNYKSEPEVSTRLVNLTAGRPDVVRVAAIHALATQIEKRAAQRLVELVNDPAPAVAGAASDALQTFASLPLSAPADWADWWRSQADRADDRFRMDMLMARSTRFEQEARHGDETFQELRRKVIGEVNAAEKDQRGVVLAGYLQSPREVVRLIAVRQAYDYATSGDLPANCRPIVLSMLSDNAADVRYEAARALQPLNDPDAFNAIAQQLAVETNTRVRVELAKSIGPIGNLRAVPLLEWLLDDSSNAVVQSAADALAGLGDAIVTTEPNEAAGLSSKLQSILQARAATPTANPRLRESLVRAMVPLKQPETLSLYTAILAAQPAESQTLRGLATRGIGNIDNDATTDLLVDVLRGDDTSPVRVEAVTAIGKVSKDFSIADAIYRSMDPAREKDPNVRDASWKVLKQLFELAPRKQLASWPDQPLIRSDVEKRLAVYDVLARKSAAEGASEDQTLYLQQVGDCQMEMGTADPARFIQATATYQKALDITRQTRGPSISMRIETLIELSMRAMLRSRDYTGAAKFAGDLMRTSTDGYQGTVGKEFKLEAERLVNEAALDDASQLIREALAMSPALPDQYRDHLADVQKTIDTRRRERNEFAIPDVLHALAMLN